MFKFNNKEYPVKEDQLYDVEKGIIKYIEDHICPWYNCGTQFTCSSTLGKHMRSIHFISKYYN